MMITEHNYEDWFLLYIDDELTAAERKAVDDFVLQHPQYASALKAFQETKLSLDDAAFFSDKESLYKDETSEVGINNYEEYFLFYTDDELDNKQKEATERFVLQHPQLQEEFTLLQQTKLPPEVIEYRNKESLYKKERRVLPLYLAGLAAAAVVFAVLFFAGLFTSQQQHNTTYASARTAQTSKPVVKSPGKETVMNDVTDQANTGRKENTTADKAIKSRNEKTAVDASAGQETHSTEQQTSPVHQQAREEVAVVAQHEDAKPLQPTAHDNNATAKQASVLKPLDETDAEQTDATTALSLSDNNTVQPAVYKELNTDDDNHTLYVGSIQLNKNKVSGLLKSASRLLGGRAKQSEE